MFILEKGEQTKNTDLSGVKFAINIPTVEGCLTPLKIDFKNKLIECSSPVLRGITKYIFECIEEGKQPEMDILNTLSGARAARAMKIYEMLTPKYLCWWSAGVTSAIATKLALLKHGADNVRIIYFKIDQTHEDNARFKAECEEWYGKEIEEMQGEFKTPIEVARKTRYINGANGARCTLELKKKLRLKLEDELKYNGVGWLGQIFGFEFLPKEINRAIRFQEQYPDTMPLFPLIEQRMNKQEALHYLERNGIERPAMYKLLFSNNNCLGCFKRGQGYWNLIRKEFPEIFKATAELEREIKATCLKNTEGRIYLDELDPEAGRGMKEIMPDCGNFCDIEFTNLIDKNVENIINGTLSLEDLRKL
jgi:hypothetical protein